MDSDIKVYQMNEYEWFASRWSIEETNKWYENNFDDNSIDVVREVDLDKEGMWYQTKDKKDIEKLGDADELIDYEVVNRILIKKVQFGNLERHSEDVYKYISFRDAIQFDLDFKEPYCIASTE